MLLYHITLKCHLQSIRKGGIDPRWSTGKRRAIYLVSSPQVSWAIAHVACRHGKPVSQLVIVPVDVEPEYVYQTSKEGVYYALHPLFVGGIAVQSAFAWLNAEDDKVKGEDHDHNPNLHKRANHATV